MLNEAFKNIQRAPSLMLWPGLALGLTSGALVLLAAALRDALEDRGTAPASRRRSRRAASATPAIPAGSAVSAVSPGTGGTPQVTNGTPADAGERAGLLSVRDLAVSYVLPGGGTREVVHGVDLDVRAGEIVGLVGESGSGKTQTAFSILGILPEGDG
nr:hypothetical protein GCM10020093_050790 [Planobispora longispora]